MVFEKVEDALREMKSDLTAAECHGVLSGLMTSSVSFNRNKWFDHIAGAGVLEKPFGRWFEVLEELEMITIDAIADAEFGFDLLLVDDNARLPVRLESFAFWCKGYLSGFGLGDIRDLNLLGQDSQEFLKDIERFCLIDCRDREVDLEESEKSLVEIIEYTRVGVMLLNLEAKATFDSEKIRDS